MIRINLMGAAVKRPKAKALPEGMAISAPPALMIGIGLIVAALLALVGNYVYVARQSSVLGAQLVAAQQEAQRLQAVRREFQENTQRRQLLTQRIGVINDLKQSQAGPTALLAALRRSVDATPSVWLTAVTNKGGDLQIAGSALDLTAVANLMTAMNHTGYFREVNLHSSDQQTGRDSNPFQFTLTATPESALPDAAVATSAPAPGAPRS